MNRNDFKLGDRVVGWNDPTATVVAVLGEFLCLAEPGIQPYVVHVDDCQLHGDRERWTFETELREAAPGERYLAHGTVFVATETTALAYPVIDSDSLRRVAP